MTDREKVIKGLEMCAADESCKNDECPYYALEAGYCETQMARDALTLIKELMRIQEPRVMTLEELEDWDGAVFFEACETDMYYALIENVDLTAGMDGEYVLVNVVPGEHYRRIWAGEHYGEIWRCWTARPTEEQREAVKWDDP